MKPLPGANVSTRTGEREGSKASHQSWRRPDPCALGSSRSTPERGLPLLGESLEESTSGTLRQGSTRYKLTSRAEGAARLHPKTRPGCRAKSRQKRSYILGITVPRVSSMNGAVTFWAYQQRKERKNSIVREKRLYSETPFLKHERKPGPTKPKRRNTP